MEGMGGRILRSSDRTRRDQDEERKGARSTKVANT